MQNAEHTPKPHQDAREIANTPPSPDASLAEQDNTKQPGAEEPKAVYRYHESETRLYTYPNREDFYRGSDLFQQYAEKPWLPMYRADF